ncbi:Facilitated trehalose transporter Tret1 [Schistosoma japonicum]|uniref:Facilitated trehalose transporter Tret1 n=1 Tax=Schistosoma japonicum TaxID=6182 RepID=A0A4Z2DBW5_SCHJA|nr:Facilitated trehalose transporter Tret1 [Schistosoma japonicum]TNN13691.1 Facilitated trehalose transporter Tret1 [Schistosoma japonicum]
MDLFTIFVSTLCSLIPGLAFGFSSACTLQVYFTVSRSALFASSLNLGGLFGGLLSAHMLSTAGRRYTLLVSCVPTLLGWLWMYMCSDSVYQNAFPVNLFIFGRVLTGFGAGLCIPSVATYMLEVSPTKIRGIIGSLPQVGIVTGICISFFMAMFMLWEQIAFINAIVSCAILVLVWFLPESPKWLRKIGRNQEADNVNMRLFGTVSGYSVNAVDIDDNIVESRIKKHSRWTYIFPCSLVPSSQQSRLRIALMLMIFQQLTGVNAILFFAESVCLIGNAASPPTCAFFIGFSQAVFTVIAIFVINQVRRKTLLQLSAIIMAIALLAYGITHSTNSFNFKISEFWIILFMFGYSFGWGPLPVLISMELFPVSSRGNAVSSAIAVSWISAFITTEVFEAISTIISPSILFFTFSICCLLSMGYVHKYLPETSGETILPMDISSTKTASSSSLYKQQLSA